MSKDNIIEFPKLPSDEDKLIYALKQVAHMTGAVDGINMALARSMGLNVEESTCSHGVPGVSIRGETPDTVQEKALEKYGPIGSELVSAMGNALLKADAITHAPLQGRLLAILVHRGGYDIDEAKDLMLSSKVDFAHTAQEAALDYYKRLTGQK